MSRFAPGDGERFTRPAGSLRFWQGWTFMALVFIPVISANLYFYKHDPQLVERRLRSKEKTGERLGLNLPGYPEYCLRTRFRLVPFVW
jgi:hypothetical protein